MPIVPFNPSKPLSKTRISLLVELLKSFSEKELDAFTKFMDSAYFNEDQKLVDLLKKIKRYALKAEKFTEDLQLKVYEDAFCDKPLKQTELTKKQSVFLNNKQHKLLRLAEQFLMIENFKANSNTKPEFLYPTLIDRNQINLYQRHIKNETKKLDKQIKRGIDFYNKQYKIQEARLDLLIKNGAIRKEDNYDELNYYLDAYYLVSKLNYYLGQITLKNVYQNKHYQFSSLSRISSLLSLKQYTTNLLIKIHLSNIHLIETQSKQAFNNLLETLVVNHSLLPSEILRIFYVNLTNYCAAQIRKGHSDYYKNLFDIYKVMDQYNLLVLDYLIDSIILKNIINVSCVVKEFEWADKILEHHKKFIYNEFKDSVYFYNKGVIAFHEKKYVSAQDWFLKVDKINDTYELGLRIFMLQCIYETEPDFNDATKQSFESAKQFFKRNTKLSVLKRTSYINLISIFTDLYRSKHQTTKNTISKITNKMNNMEVIHIKKWLCEKIDELAQ